MIVGVMMYLKFYKTQRLTKDSRNLSRDRAGFLLNLEWQLYVFWKSQKHNIKSKKEKIIEYILSQKKGHV